MKCRKLALAMLLALGMGQAQAALERVGPTNPQNGYPYWYQDRTGLALEFCSPLNQAELDAGWCLLLPGDTTAPEAFPTAFADEHFWWAADAGLDIRGSVAGTAGRARLILALEGAFGLGPVTPGDQVVFGRIRFQIVDVPVAGSYRIIHPFGVNEFPNVAAGDKIFFTDDVGLTCGQGQFNCALGTGIGPFLLPSLTPGGAVELHDAALQPDASLGGYGATSPGGRKHIAGPARLGPVTGSPFGTNYFRLEGPAGSNLDGLGHDFVETTGFALMGRIWEQAIPGIVSAEQATYTRRIASPSQKLDVFANGLPSIPGPGQAPVNPVLSFYDAPCSVAIVNAGQPNEQIVYGAPASATEVTMTRSGTSHWGQILAQTIPAEVCVKDNSAVDQNGLPKPAYYPLAVKDEVQAIEATYDPRNQSLLVRAVSSDEVFPPSLVVEGLGPMVGGQLQVSPLVAPPSAVRILSSRGGTDEQKVKTGFIAAASAVAANDAATTLEESPIVIAVLANDSGAEPATVRVVTNPTLGATAVNLVTGDITYTPGLNKYGNDTFSYVVKGADGVDSNVATVTVSVINVNDAPVAVANATTTVLSVPAVISLLGNDTDADGQVDLAGVQIVQPPAQGTLTTGQNGVVTYTPAATGQFTFTYQAVDAAGALSNVATVTVDVVAAETLTADKAFYRRDQARWVVSGTSSVLAGQNVTIRYVDGPSAGTVLGLAVVDGLGDWIYDVTGAPPPPAGATKLEARSDLGATAILSISVR